MKPYVLILIPAMFVLSGCETLQSPRQRQQAEAREQAAARMTQERVHRLQGQVESIAMENARLSQEMQQLRRDVQALNQQYGHVSTSVQTLESRRARDKQEVVEQVSKRVGSLIEKQAASTARSSGREHVVESGHTLSAIAAAYGSSVKSIKRANKLKSDSIYVGQKLFIPE